MLCREEEQSFKSLNCSGMAGRGGGGGGSVEGSYLANLFAPAAVFTDKCSLQMKPDSLGMLLNPSTIARENATCKPCMKRERLERFRSCAG